MKILVFGVLLVGSAVFVTGVPIQPGGMRSFSSAIKDGVIAANTEKVLYEYHETPELPSGGCGVITEQWFTGQGVMDENMRIRIYIDGEEEASIDFMLLLGHGIGSSEKIEAQYVPWGTRRIGHNADGAIYNTYQIPFYKSFMVTATHPTGGMFWYIIRGVDGMPAVVGNLELPLCNTRLKLYKNVDVNATPYEFLTVVNVTNTAGLLYQVTLFAESSDYEYLEGCFRAEIDSDNITWLSSGTEDFFLSGYYFNRGVYHTDNSGLTYKEDPGTMSAYKFFESDPILFSKSFALMWRCGDDVDPKDHGCPSDWPPPPEGSPSPRRTKNKYSKGNGYGAPRNTTVTSYVWMYEYII